MVGHATSLLFATGVAPNDVVVLTFPNTTEFVLASLAVIRCGATAAPLEFEFYILDSEAERLITANEGNKSAEPAASKLRIPHVTAMLNDGESELSLLPSSDVTAELNSVAGISTDQSEVALFLHTSGTMSRPKGVLLTQLNLASSVRNMGSAYKFSESDSTMLIAPLFHANGLTVELLSSLAAGAAVVLPAACIFSVKTFWSDMRTYNAMRYTAVPIIHRITLYRHFEQVEPAYPALRLLRSCVAWLAPSVLARLEEAFGSPVLEASQMSTNLLPEGEGHKSGSVGKPVGLEMASLNPNGMPMKEGVSGKVCIWGPNVTKGYKNNPEANKGAFSFGWFHTGDVGFFDSGRYLHLVDRIKDLIHRGGEIIAPIEVHPCVGRAVGFGIPDDQYGKKALRAAMVGHNINVSLVLEAADVGMATGVSIEEGYDIEAINAVSGENNSEDVTEAPEIEITTGSDTNEQHNIGPVDAHPKEDNREDVATVGDLWKQMGPDCVWASGCTLKAIAAAAGLPIFGHRFTPAICAAVVAASLFRVLSRYLALKKCIPENLDIQEMTEIRIDQFEED